MQQDLPSLLRPTMIPSLVQHHLVDRFAVSHDLDEDLESADVEPLLIGV